MTTPVTELSVGDRFLYLDDVMVTVVRSAEPWNEPFGRPGFVRLEGRRNDTGAIGWMPFGPCAEVLTVECVPGCTGHPILPEGWTSWQQAIHTDLSGGMLTAWKTTEPVTRAASLSHNVVPIDNLGRWRCRDCDATVIVYDTSIYGSAVERSCSAPAGTSS